jgi:ribokinase
VDVICTLGSEGAIYVVDGQFGIVPTPKVRAIDTTAAGDTVVGYLAAHSTLPLADRLRLAVGAGALTVTRAGASSSIPELDDVELMLANLTERTPA